MRIGVDYYPEQWDRSRWETDAGMMQAAGISLIRIAEFSWSLSEKEEGKFDFGWLDEVIDLFSAHQIRIVLCTPTATPPKWLVDRYPSILQEDRYNHVRQFGSRRHYCFNSKEYQEKTSIIVEQLARHFAGHPAVEAWQIDNEFGCQDTAYCYCDKCQEAFRGWLKEKYKTVEQLNKACGTVFWSQIYRNFDEIILPKASTCETSCPDTRGQNPSLFLDYKRFSSDSVIRYQRLQRDILKKYTKAPVTNNLMGSYSEIDYFKLAADLDFVSWDNYLDTQWGKGLPASASMDSTLMRSLKKKPMWVMEQQSGPCGWGKMGSNPEPGKIRLWTYQSIANGAETVVYFRWRAALAGTEQYWHGILNHDGKENRRYREVCRIGEEIRRLNRIYPAMENNPDVAIIKSYDSLWSHSIHPHAEGFHYGGMLHDTYQTLYDKGINADFAAPEESLTRYKLVFAPALNLVDASILANLTRFVQDGGHLVLTYRSGTRTMDNTMLEQEAPGAFADLAGATAYDFDPLSGRTVPVNGIYGKGTAKIWCDVMKLETAAALAVYGAQYYNGEAAITENRFGKGRVYYLGCDLDEKAMDKLYQYFLDQAGVTGAFRYMVPGVEVSKMNSGGDTLFFILNHNDHKVMMKLGNNYTNVMSGEKSEDILLLEPYDVVLLKEAR